MLAFSQFAVLCSMTGMRIENLHPTYNQLGNLCRPAGPPAVARGFNCQHRFRGTFSGNTTLDLGTYDATVVCRKTLKGIEYVFFLCQMPGGVGFSCVFEPLRGHRAVCRRDRPITLIVDIVKLRKPPLVHTNDVVTEGILVALKEGKLLKDVDLSSRQEAFLKAGSC